MGYGLCAHILRAVLGLGARNLRAVFGLGVYGLRAGVLLLRDRIRLCARSLPGGSSLRLRLFFLQDLGLLELDAGAAHGGAAGVLRLVGMLHAVLVVGVRLDDFDRVFAQQCLGEGVFLALRLVEAVAVRDRRAVLVALGHPLHDGTAPCRLLAARLVLPLR